METPHAHHPTMTDRQFDLAVHRAHCDGCRVIPSGVAGIVFVSSGSRPGICYRVTRTSCSCPAGKAGRPCKHVALACFEADILGTIGRRRTPNNVVFLHRRHEPLDAA